MSSQELPHGESEELLIIENELNALNNAIAKVTTVAEIMPIVKQYNSLY